MGLNETNKRKLAKKLKSLKDSQIVERAKYIERRELDKEGDKNWQKYVMKQLNWFDKYQKVEFKRYRVMMTRAYLDDQKGKKPSPHINL